VLINNAGVMAAARAHSADGYDLTFAVNHLAPFLLTNLLLTSSRSPRRRRDRGALNAHRRARLDFSDLMNARVQGFGPPTSAPSSPTCCSRARSPALAGSGVTVNTLHPGLVNSHLFHNSPALLRVLLASVGRWFLLSPQQGARGSVYLAQRRVAASRAATTRLQARGAERAAQSACLPPSVLWQESARLTGAGA